MEVHITAGKCQVAIVFMRQYYSGSQLIRTYYLLISHFRSLIRRRRSNQTPLKLRQPKTKREIDLKQFVEQRKFQYVNHNKKFTTANLSRGVRSIGNGK